MQRSKRARSKTKTEQVNVYLAPTIKLRLKAMSGVLGHSQAWVVTEAIAAYFQTLPPKAQQSIEESMAIRQRE